MIIYGKQLFLHILERRKESIKRIFLSKEIDKKLFKQVSNLGLKIERIDNQKAQALAHGGNHQGFLAEVDDFVFAKFESVKRGDFVAVLWGVSDVGNIGAIARSAWAFGVSGLVVVAKGVNAEGVLRTSSGAAFELPICVCEDGGSALNELRQQGFTLCVADAKGVSALEVCEKNDKFGEKVALVMGSEGQGVPQKIVQKCDHVLSVKMAREFDSLNVSVAFGILCYELSKINQKGKK